ncbi:MAG: TerB family tellurite resistance protein [Alphaproteobacteria bacterium]|nr:TerB family tellurite resistance protein [Alphaproteobacteria bacterium]
MQLASAGLLVEAALMDEDYAEVERQRIAQLLGRHFHLSPEAAAALLTAGERRLAKSVDLFGMVRVINDRYGPEERLQIIEMLWEVAYADGTLDDHESSLLRRIAGLLYVTDQQSGAARKRVLNRLGL